MSRTGSCARREAIILSVDTDSTPDTSPSTIPDGAEDAHPLQAGAPVRPDSPTFAELGVRPEIVAALAEAGIERAFAIQELTLPLALAGEDVIGQARTGMGKTLGFGVPLLQRVVPPAEQPAAGVDGEAADRTKDVPQALVVVPTRELCVQVAKDIADAGRHLGIRVTAIYGGRAYEPQLAALRKGVDVVVGTPGRLLDLAEQRHLVLGRVKALVLDEADEMLDLGFLPDVERTVQRVADDLADRGFAAAAVHGDLGQSAREQALRAFRAGKIDVLVATDVAARGIDVAGVSHVVNYQCPEDEKTYVHRIGRTGRAGSTGVAVTLVDWDDIPRWQLINKALDLDFADPPETYSTSTWVYTDLDVPETATGRLPRAQRTREGLEAETLEDLGETGKRNRPTSSGGRDSGGRGDSRGPSGGRQGAPRSGDGEQ